MQGYRAIGASDKSAISVTVFIAMSNFSSAVRNMSSGYSTILPVMPTNIAGLAKGNATFKKDFLGPLCKVALFSSSHPR